MKTPTIQQEYDSYIDMLYNEDISEDKEMIKSLREQINSFAIGESEK